jgi:putative transposase
MEEDSVVRLLRPGSSISDDPLLAVLRDGARRMLRHAIEAEVEGFIAVCANLVNENGRRRVVRNGYAPERQLQTGIGPIAVRRPKVRDRGTEQTARIRFTSAVLPAYLRRTKNVEELLPWLYLKGISTGQFEEALAALVGADAPGLSATTVRRLTAAWQDEHERWRQRDLSARHYVYLWADGVYFTPRLEHDRQCSSHRRQRAGTQGAAGNRGRLPGERPELARAAAPAARPERARARPRARHRRRFARLLASPARGLAKGQATTLLGSQDR